MRKHELIPLGVVITLLVAIAMVAEAPRRAFAGPCNYPLFSQASAVDANVVILFDTSGSMNEAICHAAYNPTIVYPGGLDRTQTYYVSSDGTYSARSFKSGLPTSPTAHLVDSDGGQDGRYFGNYLNWLFYSASSTQRAEIPQITRIQMAKTAVNAVLSGASPSLRFGLFKFNNDNGATKVCNLGTSISSMQSSINNLEGDSWTPLAESMNTILNYLKTTGASAPIQYECQKTFIVVATDGYPTYDLNVPTSITGGEPAGTCADLGGDAMNYPSSYDCSGFLDNVCGYLRTTDLRADLTGQQYACTYTIGMNVDAPILQASADAGDGEYFSADDAAELDESLTRVFSDIINRISAGSAVAVVSTEGQTEDLLYRGKFDPQSWKGILEAFTLPYTSGDQPVWEAGQILSQRTPSTRKLFTFTGGVKRDIIPANAAVLRTALAVSNNTIATNLINWMLGNTVSGYRDRKGWPLGDIIDSSPVPVGAPTGYYLYNDYLAFRDSKLNRQQVVYVGANDGMLHCFDAHSGDELWGYVPGALLPRLQNLASTSYCHEFFVNQQPRAADVYLGGQWKTVVLGGLKEGGSAYYCLDVTNPTAPTVLWETSAAEVGQSWAIAEITRLKPSNKFVAFVGSGYRSTGEAYLIGFDMQNGAVLWKPLLNDIATTNIATGCTAVDLDFDGYDDLLYLGDLTGKLWRVNISGATPVSSLLFQSASNQAIQAPPIVTVDYNNDVFIYFGTGKYVEAGDISTTYSQRFYCVIDKHTGGTVALSSLVNQSGSLQPMTSSNRGWYINLTQKSGERVVQPAALVNGIVYFTSLAPSNASCSGGGSSWFYSAKFRNGAGYDGDDNDANDTTNGRVVSMGDGITAKPVIDLVNEKVMIQGSDTRVHVEDTKGKLRQMIVRSYRQRY